MLVALRRTAISVFNMPAVRYMFVVILLFSLAVFITSNYHLSKSAYYYQQQSPAPSDYGGTSIVGSTISAVSGVLGLHECRQDGDCSATSFCTPGQFHRLYCRPYQPIGGECDLSSMRCPPLSTCFRGICVPDRSASPERITSSAEDSRVGAASEAAGESKGEQKPNDDCNVDTDCPESMWCSRSRIYGNKCEYYIGEHQPCDKIDRRCSPDLKCQLFPDSQIRGECVKNDDVLASSCTRDITCTGHGHCREDGTCSCDSGWTGSSCRKRIGSTETNTALLVGVNEKNRAACSGHGVRYEEGACLCDRGWTGQSCNQIDPETFKNCGSNSSCSGNGFCVSQGSSRIPHCECKQGWYGAHCGNVDAALLGLQRKETHCFPKEDNECSLHGVCTDTGSTFNGKCKCDRGWRGDHCQHCDPDIGSAACNGHGECVAGGRCRCRGNYYGSDCGRCKQGFFGRKCEPCKCVNGICNEDGSCTCFYTHVGENCDQERTCFDDSFCGDHGKCDKESGKCLCDELYTGADCSQVKGTKAQGWGMTVYDKEQDTTLPEVNAKLTIGTTTVVKDELNLHKDELAHCKDSSQCQNGGSCEKGKCICQKDYFGPRCTILMGRGSGFTTREVARAYGFTDASDCGARVCSGNGNCTLPNAPDDKQNCSCETGWVSKDCSVRIEDMLLMGASSDSAAESAVVIECSKDTECSLHGKCVNGTCQCEVGWDHADPLPCARCQVGYFMRTSFFGYSCEPCFPDGLEECRRSIDYVHILVCYDCHSIHGRHPKFGVRTTMRSAVMNARQPRKLFFHIMTLPECVNDQLGLKTEEEHEKQWLGVKSFMRNVRRELTPKFGNILMEYGVIDHIRLDFMKLFPNASRLYNPLVIGHHLYTETVFPGLQKLIVLDTDTLVVGDIEELWNLDMEGNPLMAVPICQHGFQFRDAFNFSEPMIASRFEPDACTFSNGICVVNLTYWHNHRLTEQAEKWSALNIQYDGRLAIWLTLGKDLTKSLMNLMFYGKYKHLDNSWNTAPACRVHGKNLMRAKILHYSGWKPWDPDESKGQCSTQDLYFRYAGVTSKGKCIGWKCAELTAKSSRSGREHLRDDAAIEGT